MKAKDLTAKEIVCRYWRGYRLIRALRWVGCIACIAWLAPHIWRGGSMVTAALAFLLYLGYLFVLRLVNSLRFLSLNLILNRDCDAVKFTEVSRLLKEKLGTRTSGMAGLNTAWGLYWSGCFAEAEAALSDVELKGENPQGRLLLRNLDFNCRMQRGDVAGARHVRQETETYIQKRKPGSAAEKAANGCWTSWMRPLHGRRETGRRSAVFTTAWLPETPRSFNESQLLSSWREQIWRREKRKTPIPG